jgi:hypothetical protein
VLDPSRGTDYWRVGFLFLFPFNVQVHHTDGIEVTTGPLGQGEPLSVFFVVWGTR